MCTVLYFAGRCVVYINRGYKMAENGCIGWDEDVSEQIANENHQGNDGFVVLPEGDYPFEVNKVERTRFAGSALSGL